MGESLALMQKDQRTVHASGARTLVACGRNGNACQLELITGHWDADSEEGVVTDIRELTRFLRRQLAVNDKPIKVRVEDYVFSSGATCISYRRGGPHVIELSADEARALIETLNR